MIKILGITDVGGGNGGDDVINSGDGSDLNRGDNLRW